MRRRSGRGVLVLLTLLALQGCGGDAHHSTFFTRIELADSPPKPDFTSSQITANSDFALCEMDDGMSALAGSS